VLISVADEAHVPASAAVWDVSAGSVTIRGSVADGRSA
jgi:hypothetical protein